MKKETIKEAGKLFLDLSKIIFAIAVLTPLVKNGSFQFITTLPAVALAGLGLYFTNKGVDNG